jgi:hypothetical protein
MARRELDREDLLRDALALSPRIQLQVQIDDRPAEVFAGFRSGALSLYFDQDPVYHFNARGELRRAFVDGRLFKAEDGRLVALERRRSSAAVTLSRTELDAQAEQAFLAKARAYRQHLLAAIAAAQYRLVGQEPPDVDVTAELVAWLKTYPEVPLAARPNVRP